MYGKPEELSRLRSTFKVPDDGLGNYVTSTPFKAANESGRVHIDLTGVKRAEFVDLNVMLDLMSIWSAQIQPSINDSHEYATAQQAVLDNIRALADSVVQLKRFH
jgi:hypothetical protein